MAKKNYVLAIGGTGSKVVEALLHLCDCGHFDADEIKLLLIDSDETCGNKVKVNEVIKRYRECQMNFRKIDMQQGLRPLFGTRIVSVFPAGTGYDDVFTVSPVRNVSSDKAFKINTDLLRANGSTDRDAANLMKALYSEVEYNRDIKDGFYAHPSLGSLMFARWLDSSPAISALIQSIQNDAANFDQVNIFIIASSFGGTGASGFPALAKCIRDSVALSNHQNKIHIGGAFLLPYYTFVMSDGTNINPNLYDEAAKNSLKYYKDQGITSYFEKIYMLACPQKIVRGTYADFGPKQDNWPHLLELFAAFATDSFFRNEPLSKTTNDNEKWLTYDIPGRTKLEDVSWTDFPNSDGFEKLFSTFLMFNLTYVTLFLAHFMKVHSVSDEFVRFAIPEKENQVNFRAIEKCTALKQACWGGGGNRRSEVTSEIVAMKFNTLYEYLCYYTEWLYRLVTDYTGDYIGGARIINDLLGQNTSSLKNRYLLNAQLKDDPGVYQYVKDWKQQSAAIEASLKHNIRVSGIYDDLRTARLDSKVIGNDVDKAAQELLQAFYTCVERNY